MLLHMAVAEFKEYRSIFNLSTIISLSAIWQLHDGDCEIFPRRILEASFAYGKQLALSRSLSSISLLFLSLPTAPLSSRLRALLVGSISGYYGQRGRERVAAASLSLPLSSRLYFSLPPCSSSATLFLSLPSRLLLSLSLRSLISAAAAAVDRPTNLASAKSRAGLLAACLPGSLGWLARFALLH